MYYRCAPSTGTETISWTGVPAGFWSALSHFKNISCTVDVQGSTIQTGSVTNVSVGLTTTKNGDLIVAMSGHVGNEGVIPHGTSTYPEQYALDQNPIVMTFTQAGLAGSYTVQHDEQNAEIFAPAVNAIPMTMQAIAFQPSGIAVTTTAFANCDTTIAYKATLAAVGGSGSYTYSVNSGSLPAGTSLSSAGVITGTCTTPGTATFTIHVTDGSTSANNGSLTITTDSGTYSTPRIVQAAVGVSTASLASPVQSGNTGIAIVQGFDSDGGRGWVNAYQGSTNFVLDSQGNTYKRACPIIGSLNSAFQIFSAKFTGTAPPTFSWTKTSGGSPINVIFLEVSGTQNVIDCAGLAYASRESGSPYSVGTSYTTPVASEMLLAATAIGFVFNGSWSMSFSAGFGGGPAVQSTVYGGIATGTQSVAGAGAYSETTTVTSGVAVADTGGTLLIGLRPGLLSLPAQPTGEKTRRPIS